jgi:hypothetical protein
MPRQNFISKNFFIRASQQQSLKAILEIPGFAKGISFIKENTLVQTWRFLYVHTNGREQYIDVSLIHLNDGHTHVTLHGTYLNGRSFYKDRYIANALGNFELAVKAAIQGSAQEYVPGAVKTNKAEELLRYMMIILSSMGVFLVWKKVA